MTDMTRGIENVVYAEAYAAAMEACNSAVPVPMIVGQAKGLFGNEIVPGTAEFVSDGVCGFAWVHITPARGPFVSWCKKRGPHPIGYTSSYGGYDISMRMGNQSMQRKEAAGLAFAKVLNKYGINAYMASRMD
jgi:hypothetical protein